MSARPILSLRRVPLHPAPDDDAITLDSVNLRCGRCGNKWAASLGEFGDEVPADQAHCPTCAPELPPAA